jgi:16S rRNA (cytosine967-C5)-methyltransferase
MKKKLTHTRAISATILADLLEQQQPFIPYAAKAYAFAQTQEDKAFITDLCFQTLRAYPKVVLLSQQFLDKPFRQQDTDVFCLLLIGLGELDREQKSHAAIFEAVEGCVYLNKPWAKKVVNACLRSYQREKNNLATRLKNNLIYQTEHPSWLIEKIKTAWPHDWEKILLANNQHPPMTLWVNPKKISLKAYQPLITAEPIDPVRCPFGLNLLKPISQQELPDYALGAVNVQNASAQLAAEFLTLNDTQSPYRILDACAAPGNKTANILAKLTHPDSHVLALDVHKKRLKTAQSLLTRLGLDSPQVTLEVANASNPAAWWDQIPFDRILLDAPCSGTGVIRRHPDIKCHLTPERISETKAQQAKLLNALWPLLKPGGLFLYSTCSVLPEENEDQIAQLLSLHTDIKIEPLNTFSPKLNYGIQILPQGIWDGFYYCLMSKKSE